MSRQPRASGYFRTDYGEDISLLGTRLERASLAVVMLLLLAFPLIASPFQLDLACQVFLACVGALSLMLLTGYAGQISLGHAGLIAAGAFTVGILFREADAPFWITLPCAAAVGALLGVIFGLPSLRLRGLYLAVSTLALYFVVVYLGELGQSWAGDLSGPWTGSGGGKYWIRQVGSCLWWYGESSNGGKDFTNVFFGTVKNVGSTSTVEGVWADVPRGPSLCSHRTFLSRLLFGGGIARDVAAREICLARPPGA